jgi:hypothetical protein
MKNWQAISERVHEEMWQGEIPQVNLNLHNAVSSLAAQLPNFWESPEKIPELLAKNPGVSAVFTSYDSDSIAHAIRAYRYAKTAR